MIDLGIMNDFADNEKPSILENFARSISEIDCPLDAVAKTELFRQAHGGVAYGNNSASPANLLDNIASIVRFDLLLHCGHHIRGAEVHFLPCGCAAGNQVRAHIIVVILSEAKNLGSFRPEIALTDSQRCFASLNMT